MSSKNYVALAHSMDGVSPASMPKAEGLASFSYSSKHSSKQQPAWVRHHRAI